ncbi:hypothetical protein OAG68_02025, partial [bacterium]|nr:hypothetical protein [bacterium]
GQSVITQQSTNTATTDDFAPPNNSPRTETRFGSGGMAGVTPRENTSGQIQNYLKPIPESEYAPHLSDSQTGKDLKETAGRLELIVENYPNGSPRLKRYVAQDENGNYYNQGLWQLLGKREELTAEGEFDRGRMSGNWKRLHNKSEGGLFATKPFSEFEGPYRSYAEFNEGKLDGVWKITDRFEQVIFEMPYSEGQRNGTATWYHTNSERMREVTFKDGVIDGMVFEWNERQDITRQEEYYQGRKVVKETQFFKKDQPQSQNFYRDAILEVSGSDDWWNAKPAAYVNRGERVQHGATGTWFPNGQPQMRGQFEDGLRQGVFLGWHSNGQKEVVGRFEKDQRVGNWTWWYSNGFKSVQGEFDDGVQVGEWTWWNEDGTVRNRRDMGREKRILETNHQNENEEPSDAIINLDKPDPNADREEIRVQELPEKNDDSQGERNSSTDEDVNIPMDVIPVPPGDESTTENEQSESESNSAPSSTAIDPDANKAEEILSLPEDE